MNIEELQKQMITSPMNTREFIALSMLQGRAHENPISLIDFHNIQAAFDFADRFIKTAAKLRLEEDHESDKPCNCDEK